MERVVSELMAEYDRGTLSRRQLIGSLVAMMTTATPAAAAGLAGTRVDHFSLQVRDVARSRDFYTRVFSMSQPAAPRPDGSVHLHLKSGPHLVLRPGDPAGRMDHVSIRLDRFDKAEVTRQLGELGLTPIDEPTGAAFHVIDPDGFNVQIQ